MKALFVYPNMFSALSISPAIASLSAVLKRDGHQVALVHLHPELGFDFDPERESDLNRVVKVVKQESPDLIGITATSFEYEAVNKLAGVLKSRGVAVPVILGGAHATFCPSDFSSSRFDAFCVGEGELPLAELGHRIDCHCPKDDLFRDLPSFLSATVCPTLTSGPVPLSDPVEDLDTLPRMDRQLFDMDRIIESRDGWVDVFTARGCPYACTYCCNHVFNRLFQESKGRPRGYRQRAVRAVVDEILRLRQEYGDRVKVISFQEDFLNYDRRWMLDFCRVYGDEVSMPFYMCARPDSIDRDMAEALRSAGCIEVSLGIETGSESLRNKVLRKSMPDQCIYTAARCLHEFGVRIFANIMLGLPHESWQTLRQTAELLGAIRPRLIRPTILIPLRGTDIHEYCLKNGLLRDDADTERSLFEQSVLRFDEFDSLELLRYRYLLGWTINAAISGSATGLYRSLLAAAEHVPTERWLDRRFLQALVSLDEEVSQLLRSKGIEHYHFFHGLREIQELGHVKRFKLWRKGRTQTPMLTRATEDPPLE